MRGLASLPAACPSGGTHTVNHGDLQEIESTPLP
jgi:hypothetical protein